MFGLFSKDITSPAVAIAELKKLNPKTTIEHDDTYGWVSIDCDVQALRLPKGFYANEKNGITNKHNTKTGAYVAIAVI